MRNFHIVVTAMAAVVSSCSSEINAPAEKERAITFKSVATMMAFNANEQSLFDELTAGMPSDKAARIRAKFFEPGVIVAGTNDREQELINAIYSSIHARAVASRGRGRPKGPPPATSQNTWIPKGDDLILINAFVNRYPEVYRARIKADLLRIDIRLSVKPGDQEGERILDQIYERRERRILDAAGNDWR